MKIINNRWIAYFSIILFALITIAPFEAVFAQNEDAPEAVVLTIKGPLTPVFNEYLKRGFRIAEERRSDIIILEMDTPGGSIDVMNNMIQQIRASQIPVVVYVSPRGAMAASAGTIITLAGHIAAMAPETAIGAASPVGPQGEDIDTTLESKTKEILKASVRSIAKDRTPEAIKLAEETIESAIAVTVQEAVEVGLVDVEALNIRDLLQKLDGRSVKMDDQDYTLHTKDATTFPIRNTFIEEVIQLLTNPNLVFLLLSIGVQAILIELSSPGGWVAGFLGAVCLILAVYGLGLLPVNWFGFLFIVVAFILFIIEFETPTYGALTIAGAGSFILGALILFNSTQVPGFPRVSVPLVIGTAIAIAASFFIFITFALRAQFIPVRVGRESLPGQSGLVMIKLNPTGQVQVGGELWTAELDKGEKPLRPGAKIEVVDVKGLTLIVRKHE